jgi:pyruvate-formate lyase
MVALNENIDTTATDPLAIEPYDKEWGVGVSALSEAPSPFPRINNILKWLKERDTTADSQRAVIYTEGYFKKYSAYPQILKCAMTYRDVLEKVDINIWPDELIVGELAAPAKSAPVYPEFSIDWLCDEMLNSPLDQRRNDRYVIDEDTKKALLVRIAGYSAYFVELSEELQSDLINRTELSFD